ncbi:MAG TPA: ABC transporter ATP-binding protein [Catalimonadaceae bacterium]|nr:ABC transporter ATP-binding protein [Catalimonadaceae bacterium]HPI11875.1 ABC transporter ATP-binding protein [Catalimonadaceae bacterium]
MLDIQHLSKTYSNGVKAINNISLQIKPGMFGLLGPNGAGKSSLMRTIATLQLPDEGTLRFDTIDILSQPQELRKILGYLPQEFGVYPKVSAEELLTHLAVLKGMTDTGARKEWVDFLLHKTNLYDVRKKNLGTYSGGMKQRFGIAQALLGKPRLIIVDEPTAGLDPAERNRFHNLLSEIGETTVVILSTHIVEDVSNLCNDMAIINKGSVVANGRPQETLSALEGKIFSRIVEKAALEEYSRSFRVLNSRLMGGKPQLFVYADSHPGDGFLPVEAGLEEVYFYHING